MTWCRCKYCGERKRKVDMKIVRNHLIGKCYSCHLNKTPEPLGKVYKFNKPKIVNILEDKGFIDESNKFLFEEWDSEKY